jgi:hypothetical protein
MLVSAIGVGGVAVVSGREAGGEALCFVGFAEIGGAEGGRNVGVVECVGGGLSLAGFAEVGGAEGGADSR